LLKHGPPHDSAQLGAGEEELGKAKGREDHGMRIQGKDGKKVNRSFLDRSSANMKYFYYINS